MAKKLGKHKTIIDGAQDFVKCFLNMNDVRLRCGVVKVNLTASSPNIKINLLSGCVKATYRAKNACETFFIYGDNSKLLQVIQDFTTKRKIDLLVVKDNT